MNVAPATLLLLSLCGYVAGIAGGLVLMRREKLANAVSFGAAALSGLSGVLAALFHLSAGAGAAQIRLLPALVPYIQFTVRPDPLGSFFLLLVSLLGFAISTYSLGYAQGTTGGKTWE